MNPAPEQRADVVVIGGGPSGATAAAELAARGLAVVLVEPGSRIKPCGGAIPPLLLSEFDIPPSCLKARVVGARITAPSARQTNMAIGDGYVGMVDREDFDPWLRRRAEGCGARHVKGRFRTVEFGPDGSKTVRIVDDAGGEELIRCKLLIGADGANSAVRRAVFGKSAGPPYVFAYHEIVDVTGDVGKNYDPSFCDVHYDGAVSPDFYGWVFPHGPAASIGVGTAVKGFDLKQATALLRARAGLTEARTIRMEGAPLPLWPMRRWDDRRGVVLVGDAAGCVAPASGEGIYYAMLSGRFAAEAGAAYLATGNPRRLAEVRKRFMRGHGLVFLVLRVMQSFWYRNDARRERFAAICADPDVQRLTWEAYLNKRIVWADPLAHLRVFWKDLGHIARMITG
jgi:geranylgeranyl reductase